MSTKTKILFDGNCIVCDLEIAHYKKVAPETFELVDISSTDFDATQYGLSKVAVNHHLHVITPSGEILKGVQAFAHIWSRMPRYRLASKIVRMPIVYQVALLAYEGFARIRHLLPKKSR